MARYGLVRLAPSGPKINMMDISKLRPIIENVSYDVDSSDILANHKAYINAKKQQTYAISHFSIPLKK